MDKYCDYPLPNYYGQFLRPILSLNCVLAWPQVVQSLSDGADDQVMNESNKLFTTNAFLAQFLLLW